MKHISIFTAVTIITLLTACNLNQKDSKHTIYVSIAPLKYMVEQIAQPGTTIEVLVPETTSPESYEPTPQQIRALTSAQVYLSIGLMDFEQALEKKIRNIAPNTIYLNLSAGLNLIEGQCRRTHREAEAHYHPTDPHTWLSPSIMKEMGLKTAALLGQLEPDSIMAYQERAIAFTKRIDALDAYIQDKLKDAKRRKFAIGHTSLTYFARDYDLEQVAVEVDGKEPGARAVKQLVDSLQKTGITTVFYQKQITDAAAKMVANELPNGRAIEYDPLTEDWMGNMYRITDTLQAILN